MESLDTLPVENMESSSNVPIPILLFLVLVFLAVKYLIPAFIRWIRDIWYE